ncbi:hypothetical protein I3760_02G053000 [Carya illinoinensis]|nr:hypothetical protein I3760_02G053000 [Carya illinoinensis]
MKSSKIPLLNLISDSLDLSPTSIFETMGLSFPLIILIVRFLVSLMMFHLILAASSSDVYPLCHDDERFALLQFKESFIINQSASKDASAYPKVLSWKPDQISDCCKWDGVECNKDTGHVIALDLSSSCLKGFLNSNSSLFRLAHLQNLNLADNDFNSSPVPTSFRQLSRLTELNLSYSIFSGQIPSEILELSKLVFMDLSYNPLFKLQKSGLRVIAQNFTNLEVLHLDQVVISSNVPNILANLTSLTSLSLSDCDLHGEFPVGIFHLPNLQLLDIQFNRTSPLVSLKLGYTNFYGELPDSIGNLKSLVEFHAFYCNFSGEIPSSLGNLTNLIVLRLQSNRLHGSIPQSISRLVNLEVIYLHDNDLSGTVEFELFLRLRNLLRLQLSGNDISLLTKPSTNSTFPKFWILSIADCDLGEFPEFLRNQDQLELLDLVETKFMAKFQNGWGTYLEIDSNMLQGSLPIPPPSIASFSVSNNRLTGEIPHLICNLSLITNLDLSSNNLGGLLPQCLGNLSYSLSLDLHGNNFHGSIPRICGETNNLLIIDFSQNHLQGRVPRSLANCTKLEAVNLGNNQIHDIFPSWLGNLPELRILILRSNKLYGAIGSSDSNFDFPKLHIVDLSNNDLTGKLPSEHFLNWKAMQIVDAASLKYVEERQTSVTFAGYTLNHTYSYSMTMINKGIETVYERVPNFLIVIDLSSNRFEGEIPEVVGNLKRLNLLNLSSNFLTGPIPFALANLTGLEALDLSQNKLLDSPPPFSSHNSEFSFEFGWKVVAMGYGCGFVCGAVSGQMISKKYGRFMKMFAIWLLEVNL